MVAEVTFVAALELVASTTTFRNNGSGKTPEATKKTYKENRPSVVSVSSC